MRNVRRAAALLALTLAGGAPSLAAAPTYLRIHLDVAKPGERPAVEATRAEYRGWTAGIRDTREVPVHFLRVGERELWAVRPAGTWSEMSEQAANDGRVADAVRSRVGEALDGNDRRMHGAIERHHNEILRRDAARSRDAAIEGDAWARGVRWLVRIDPRPDRGDALDAQVQAWLATRPGLWCAGYVSSPGTGRVVLLIGGDGGGPDARELRSAWASLAYGIEVERVALARELGNVRD